MRQLVLDTETTGLEPKQGHRIIEIAAVEMINRRLTGDSFHFYLNPEREVDYGAFKVHGISNKFLADKQKFSEIAEIFLNYVDGADLIIHNAPFDVGFINNELTLVGAAIKKIETRCKIIDTLDMARKKHPGQKNSLDAVCKRYHIDNSNRTLHGALLDANLLAEVYLAMTGGQTSLRFENEEVPRVVNTAGTTAEAMSGSESLIQKRKSESSLPLIRATEEERAHHKAYIASLVDETAH